jgi:uncharacterized repeat protein (TIGR03803 family)
MASDGTAFSILHSFSYLTHEGYPPGGLLIASNGDLYGVTSSSGTIPFAGTVFRIKTDGSGFAQIFNFNTNRINANWLQSHLVQDADGTLYGTAPFNQTNRQGIAFRLNPDGTGFATIHQFGSVLNGGGRPYNALLLGTDGALYGTTAVGGSYGSGTLFRLTPEPIPPFIVSIGAPSVAGFHLATDGIIGSTYVLETSTDLTNWFSIGSVSNQTGTVDFLDWSGSKDPKRFYRMLVTP